MTFRVLKNYKPHGFLKGHIVGIPDKNKDFIKTLTQEGIIEALSSEEAKTAIDGLRKDN